MRLFVLSLFLIAQCAIYAQNVTSRLTVKRGNSVSFHFNHLDDYSDGLSLNNYTVIGIYYNDTASDGAANPAGSGWKLTVAPLDDNIRSIYSGDFLDLNVIELSVYDGSTTTHSTLTGPSGVQTIIASGPGKVNVQKDITISYDVGKTNKIDKVSNETYMIDLMFTLESQ